MTSSFELSVKMSIRQQTGETTSLALSKDGWMDETVNKNPPSLATRHDIVFSYISGKHRRLFFFLPCLINHTGNQEGTLNTFLLKHAGWWWWWWYGKYMCLMFFIFVRADPKSVQQKLLKKNPFLLSAPEPFQKQITCRLTHSWTLQQIVLKSGDILPTTKHTNRNIQGTELGSGNITSSGGCNKASWDLSCLSGQKQRISENVFMCWLSQRGSLLILIHWQTNMANKLKMKPWNENDESIQSWLQLQCFSWVWVSPAD